MPVDCNNFQIISKRLRLIGFKFIKPLENRPEPYQNHNGYFLYSL